MQEGISEEDRALAVARSSFYPAAVDNADQRGTDNGREETKPAERSDFGVQRETGEDVSGGTCEGRKETAGGRLNASLDERQPGGLRKLKSRDKIAAIEKTGVKAKKGTAAQKIAEQSKKEYGVETVVIPDDVWNDAFGDDRGNIPEPGRSYGGKIYVQEGISEEDRALIVSHETTHIMRQQEFKPYMDFLENSPDKVNFVSADAQTVMGKVFEHLMVKDGGEYRLMEVDDFDIPECAQRAYDELAATVYGYHVNGITSGTAEGETLDFRNVFHDYAAYVNEPQGIHEQFKRKRERKNKQ